MPTTAEHLAQAERNEQLANDLLERDPAWAVTVIFYAALHYVEAYFDGVPTKTNQERHYDSHPMRNNAVRDRFPRHLSRFYKTLYDESFESRYRCTAFAVDEVIEYRDTHLAGIKSFVLRRLRESGTITEPPATENTST